MVCYALGVQKSKYKNCSSLYKALRGVHVHFFLCYLVVMHDAAPPIVTQISHLRLPKARMQNRCDVGLCSAQGLLSLTGALQAPHNKFMTSLSTRELLSNTQLSSCHQVHAIFLLYDMRPSSLWYTLSYLNRQLDSTTDQATRAGHRPHALS